MPMMVMTPSAMPTTALPMAGPRVRLFKESVSRAMAKDTSSYLEVFCFIIVRVILVFLLHYEDGKSGIAHNLVGG